MASESNAKAAAGSAASGTVSDNGSAFKAVKDTDRGWLMMAYGVSMGANYDNYIQALIAHMQALIDDGNNRWVPRVAVLRLPSMDVGYITASPLL